ncbi:MAG: response regulator [Caloramator sp.]|nr:response regulator [Caloramator sp.]
MIRILIADDIKETREVIRKILDMEDTFQVVGEAQDGAEVLKLIPKVKPDVILMDINMPIINGLEATERITREYPNIIVIIMSVQGESEYLRKAMFYGAKEYIIKPFNFEQLIETVKATYDRYKDLNKTVTKEKDAKIITLFSTKGGVGKTTLATNLAVLFSQSKKVLLLDLDLQFGDVAVLINGLNYKTIMDAINDDLESFSSIRQYLYSFNENLDVLFAPKSPEEAEFISKESIEKLLKALKKHYDLLVIDTGVNFSDNTLFVLDSADYIFFISNMDIASLKNAKMGLNVMKSLGYDAKKVKLIINRFNTKYGVTLRDIEETFKENFFKAVEDDEEAVIISINKGQPIAANPKYKKSKILKSLEDITKSIEI